MVLLQHYVFCFLFFEQYPSTVQQFIKEYLTELKATIITNFETTTPLLKKSILCIVTPFSIPSTSPNPQYRIITFNYLLHCLLEQIPPLPAAQQQPEEQSILFTPVPRIEYQPLFNRTICAIGYTAHERRLFRFLISSMGGIFLTYTNLDQYDIILTEQSLQSASQTPQQIVTQNKAWLLQQFSTYVSNKQQIS